MELGWVEDYTAKVGVYALITTLVVGIYRVTSGANIQTLIYLIVGILASILLFVSSFVFFELQLR